MSAVVFVTGDDRWLVARFDQALNGSVLGSVAGGRWDQARGGWRWPVSQRTAYDLVSGFTRLDGHCDASPAVLALVEAHRAAQAAQAHKTADEADVPPIDLDPLGAPPWWVHQRRAFHFARDLTACGLFISMGGGKSRIVIDLMRDADDRRVLIICPKPVVGVWPKQLRTYAPDHFTVVSPTEGLVARRSEEVATALAKATTYDRALVVVLNYDAAWREPMGELLLAQQWDRVVLDESHRVQSPSSKASKFVEKLGRRAKRRMCLTGTPMSSGPLSVFGQFRFLDPGIFGTNVVRFRNRYAQYGGYGGYEIIGWRNEEDLAPRTYSIAYRVSDDELDDILGLEEPIHETRECELSASARALYKKLWRDFCADVGDGSIAFDNALVRLLRLSQVTAGHLPVEHPDGATTIEIVDTSKREALKELLLDTDDTVVVFARFVADLAVVEEVANELERSYGELSGNRRDALTDDATLADGIDVAGINLQSGGVGVDLSAAHVCIFFDTSFSLADHEQALKRVHRPGQRRRVSYYYLVATNTVDVTIYEALREKRDVIEAVLGLAQ